MDIATLQQLIDHVESKMKNADQTLAEGRFRDGVRAAMVSLRNDLNDSLEYEMSRLAEEYAA